MNKSEIAVCWLRRDLRLHDNVALYHALLGPTPVLPVFIFDKNILDELPKDDRRVNFIHRELHHLQERLWNMGSDLQVFVGTPEEAWKKITEKYDVKAVFYNADFEPYAKERDKAIASMLEDKGIAVRSFFDHVVFPGLEVCKDDGNPYTVFTPYSRKWREVLKKKGWADHPSEKHLKNLLEVPSERRMEIPSLESMGFESIHFQFPERHPEEQIIIDYDKTRDIPAIHGTSRLGIHLRFGTISIRRLARYAQERNQTFLNELVWRDFYAMILDQFPQVVDRAFKPAYDAIEWKNDEQQFAAWKEGKTGYPIVDAGISELNATGFMHNRVRMITASFLTKHLLIDWRWGEAYFAEKLLDYELASNNGGWQWAAGSGCDAAPYFRVFNPELQTRKFDPQLIYVKRWVPEYADFNYPEPIVDHRMARERAIDTYKQGLEAYKSNGK